MKSDGLTRADALTTEQSYFKARSGGHIFLKRDKKGFAVAMPTILKV